MTARTEDAMLSWVQGTIFGAPVVPPVNMISASSGRNPSGPGLAGDGAGALSRCTAIGPADTDIGQNGRVGPASLGSPSTNTTRAPAAVTRACWSATGN